MEKEKPAPVNRQELEHNAEQGDGVTLAVGDLNVKSKNTSEKGMKSTHREAVGASDAAQGPTS
jgi:hypothetical protein